LEEDTKEGSFERVIRLPAGQRNGFLARVLEDDALRWQAELSYAQLRFWLLSLLGGNPGFNSTEAFRVTGPLDLAALDTAIERIGERHDQLRARFFEVDGVPLRLMSGAPLRLIVDSRPPAGNVRDIVEQEADLVFDLQTGPLVRCRAIIVGPEDHVLLFNVHSVVADGPSIELFYRELLACYQEAAGGPPADIPELPITYTDYVARQREFTESASLTKEVDFWRSALDGAPAVVDLPVDYPRGPREKRGALLGKPMPATLVTALNEFAQKENVAPFIVRLAAYALVLYRFAGQSDLLIGTGVSGRRPIEQNLIGQFINYVVVRADLSGNPPFRTMLQRVRRSAADAFAHAELPQDVLVDQLRVPRDPSRNPLYQLFYGEEHQTGLSGLGTAHAQRIELDPLCHAQLDLSMIILTSDDGTTIARIGYDPMLFARTTMERLVDAYLRALAAVIDNPNVGTDELDLDTDDRPPWPTHTPSPEMTISNGLIGHAIQQQPHRCPAALPTTRTEIAIADIWGDLLGEVQPDVTDDFFTVGGQSLLAVQLVRRIERTLGVRLDATNVFQSPTIRGIAGDVDRLIGCAPVPVAPPAGIVTGSPIIAPAPRPVPATPTGHPRRQRGR
jgi:hypothetical protein